MASRKGVAGIGGLGRGPEEPSDGLQATLAGFRGEGSHGHDEETNPPVTAGLRTGAKPKRTAKTAEKRNAPAAPQGIAPAAHGSGGEQAVAPDAADTGGPRRGPGKDSDAHQATLAGFRDEGPHGHKEETNPAVTTGPRTGAKPKRTTKRPEKHDAPAAPQGIAPAAPGGGGEKAETTVDPGSISEAPVDPANNTREPIPTSDGYVVCESAPPSGALTQVEVAASRWLLATNHQNMLYMLAAGMVMSPAGFGRKYYADVLATFPGWIPLFRDVAPESALQLATRERKDLRPCIAAFELAALRGPARVLSPDGALREISLPCRVQEDDFALLVPAPLSLTLLSGLSFSSSSDLQVFMDAASSVGNVDVPENAGVTRVGTFSVPGSPLVWPPKLSEEYEGIAGSDIAPKLGQALGGLVAMLYHLANRSELGVAAFRLVTEEPLATDKNLVSRDPVLSELGDWSRTGAISSRAAAPTRLFWQMIRSLVDARDQTPARETVLAFLQSQASATEDEVLGVRLRELIADLHKLPGLGAGTIGDLFERHRGSISRSVLLFCLRESPRELLEFFHPLLGETDYLLAGILFGVRDGWLGMPRELRRPADLCSYVMQRMSDVEHGRDGLRNDQRPARPVPLRELFPSGKQDWSKAQKNAAIAYARASRWTGCLRTRVDLGKGQYQLLVDDQGVHLLLDGEVAAVTAEVDTGRFLQQVGVWASAPTPDAERALREALQGGGET